MNLRLRRAAAVVLAAALAAWAAFSISRFAARGPSCFDMSYVEPGEGLLHAAHPSSVDVSYRLPLGMIFEALGAFHAPSALNRVVFWLLAGGILLMTAAIGGLLGGIWQALAAAALWLSVFDSLPQGPGFFKQLLLTFQVCSLACAMTMSFSSRGLATLACAGGLGATFLTRSSLIFLPPLWSAWERFRGEKTGLPSWAPLAAYLFLLPWVFMNWQSQGRLQLLEGGAANMNIATGALGVVTGAHGDYQTLMEGGNDAGSVTLWAARKAAANPAAALAAAGRRAAFVLGLRPFLFFLALCGLWRLRASSAAGRLALLAAYFIVVHCLMSVEDNYFEPLWPLLAVLAAGVLSSRPLSPPGGVLASTGALAGLFLSIAAALAAAGVVLRYAALARNEPPASSQAVERACREKPGDPWLRLQLGKLRLSQSRPREAAAELSRAAASEPRLAAARLEWAWARFELGESEPLLEGVFEGGIRQEDLFLRARVYRAAAALRSGRQARAREELESALQAWKNSRALLHAAATDGERAVARLLLEQAEVRFAAKAQRLLEGKPPRDLLAVQRLLGRMSPLQPELFLEAARLAAEIGLPGEALAELRKAAPLSLTREQRLALAKALRQAGDVAAAQDALSPLLAASPSLDAWIEQAEIFMRSGRLEKAQEALGKAMAARGGHEELHRLALTYQRLGRPRQALPLLEKLARLKPLDAALRSDLGLCRHLAGDSTGAVADLKLALRLSPRHWPAALTLGAVYSERGQPASARDVYEAALAQPAPAYPDPAWELLRKARETQAPK